MNYTVVWVPDAEQELAAVWLASSDRPRVTQSAHAIDQALGNDTTSIKANPALTIAGSCSVPLSVSSTASHRMIAA